MNLHSKKNTIRIKLFSLFITVVMIFMIAVFFTRGNAGKVPNLHGWTVAEVIEFTDNYPQLTVEFQLNHSEVMLPGRIFSQTIAPGVSIVEDMLLIVYVSLGVEVQ